MALPALISPLRRWKRFFGAFDSVDAAIEASVPDVSRHEFRRIRGDIVELLCDVADDDHAEAERLCEILDDFMAEYLETLRLVPVLPKVLVSTGIVESVRALPKHQSERVRVLAKGIVSGWRTSMHDDLALVRDLMHKVHNINLAQTKEIAVDLQQHVSADPDAERKQLAKKTVEISNKVSHPAAGDHAGLCSEEKMEAAKRKLNQAYQEAGDAKRRRKTQLVLAPKMQSVSQSSRARCTSSMVRKTLSSRSGSSSNSCN